MFDRSCNHKQMSGQDISGLAAVVLAGGLARRMGGIDKGLIQLGGKPMVQWALERVCPQVEHVAINANRNMESYSALGNAFDSHAAVPVINDTFEGHPGPLAGLLAALQHFGNAATPVTRFFMCPCDSPFLPHDMVERMSNAMDQNQARVAVAHDGTRQQPVFLMVDSACQLSLTEFLASGERKIDRWFSDECLVEVDFSDKPDAFLNINTEDERLRVEKDLEKSTTAG